MALEHGKLYTCRSGFKVRWCQYCNVLHGYLYDCQHFNDATRAAIKREDSRKKATFGVSVACCIIFVCLLMLLS